MTMADLLTACSERPRDHQAHHQLAELALAQGAEQPAIASLRSMLALLPGDARGWQWLGLLQRAIDRREEAIPALERALDLAPDDPSIAHGLAHVMLEAGVPSVDAFHRAIQLAPGDPSTRLGLASAMLADGDGSRALAQLGDLLDANPGWIEGHRQYGQLAAQCGADHPLQSVMAAIDRFPDGLALYETAIAALFDANQPDKVVALARRAIDRFGRLPLLAWSEAAALDEQDDRAAARVAFDVVGRPVDNAQAVWRIRHLLRRGDIGEAAAEVETRLGQGDAAALWPYAALCWRALGDARSHWLERDGELVADIDLGLAPHEIDAIVTLLRQLHRRSGRFLDQSVRHGTQTDGPLLARIDPPIMMLRERLRLAVRDYVAALPPGEPSHPLLGQRRDTWPRFAGSWSVRLGDQGFHRAHHHPQGWISSACYMVVPDGLATGIGALELGGAPAGLGLDVAPERAIQPVAGRLALFPSTMWHSTTPFPAGERITVAFDVARPLFCR